VREAARDSSKRRRSARVLSLIEREEVSRGIAAGCTIRGIAKTLNRAPSTVSQEVSRHGGRGLYRAAEADLAAWKSARRPKLCLLAKNRELQRLVAVKLKEDWAPQQIAGWLKDEYPENTELRVSHETIYRSLFVQARGVLKKELIGHLRSKRRIRRSRHATDRGTGRGQIVDAVSIRQRPAEVDDRAIPGHWEGDLVEGARGTFIATLVERHFPTADIIRKNAATLEVQSQCTILPANTLLWPQRWPKKPQASSSCASAMWPCCTAAFPPWKPHPREPIRLRSWTRKIVGLGGGVG